MQRRDGVRAHGRGARIQGRFGVFPGGRAQGGRAQGGGVKAQGWRG